MVFGLDRIGEMPCQSTGLLLANLGCFMRHVYCSMIEKLFVLYTERKYFDSEYHLPRMAGSKIDQTICRELTRALVL